MIQEELTLERAQVKSISFDLGNKKDTGSALISMLIDGVCVPIYCNVENLPFRYLPYNGERLSVNYVVKNNKIFIKSYVRQNNIVAYVHNLGIDEDLKDN